MTRRIYKYPVRLNGYPHDFELPVGHPILHVGMQYDVSYLEDVVCFWMVDDPDAPKMTRRFEVVGTGHALPTGGEPRGSVQHGQFVWHLVELP